MRQKGSVPILVLVAVIGLLGFLFISATFSFRDNFFASLFPKPASQAATLEWNQDGGNAQRTGFSPEEPLEPWTFLWSFNGPDANGGSGGHIYDAPNEARTVMGGGKIYVPAGVRGIYGLNAQTGSQDWNLTVTSFNASPAYDITTTSLFAGGSDGKVYKINPQTGNVILTYNAGSPINKALLLVGGFVFAVTDSGQLHKINTNSMTLAWSTPYSSNSTIASPPSYSAIKDVIVYTTDDLYVHAVNNSDGSQKWRVKPTPNNPGGTTPITAGGAALGTQFEYGWPVIADVHGLVLLRLRLPHSSLTATPTGGAFPTDLNITRNWLISNPQYKNLFVLDLDNGTEKFIPAIGYGSTEDYIVGTGAYGVMGSQPAIKVYPDGTEVAYINFRNGQNGSPDGNWDGNMGEMVLDDTTIPGLKAGDSRFIHMANQGTTGTNSYAHITDEQNAITLAGNSLFYAHWAASEGIKITDRSSSKGMTFVNPITTTKYKPVLRAIKACSNFNPATHFTTCGGNNYTTDGGASLAGRWYATPAFWSYWNIADPPGWRVGSGNTPGGAYSGGYQGRYTYVANGLMVVQGNGGDILVFKTSATTQTSATPTSTSTPAPTPTALPGTQVVRVNVPLAIDGLNFADGRVGFFGSANSGCGSSQWASAYSQLSGSVALNNTNQPNFVGSGCLGNNALAILRGFLAFDTSVIPTDANITSAVLKLFVLNKNSTNSDGNDFLSVVKSSQATANNLAAADFNSLGNIEGSTRALFSALTVGGYNSINLNSTGISWINKGGITNLGLREGHDLLNLAPTSNLANQQGNSIEAYLTEQSGTTQDPYLELTYTISSPLPPPPTQPSTTKLGDISGPSGVPDNKVNIFDFNQLLADFGCSSGACLRSDVEKSGGSLDKVDIFDFNTLLANFGK